MSEYRSVYDLTNDEFKAEVERVARLLALGRFRKQNSGCDAAAAAAHADGSWQQFSDAAIDFLIVREVSRGDRAAAPNN